jgi:murein DD-endopeptidase MepM/ murein hydrolase activator NlpD
VKLLIIRGIHGKTISLHLSTWMKLTLSACVLGVPMGAGWWLGSLQENAVPGFFNRMARALEQDLVEQQSEIDLAREDTQKTILALSKRIADLQARLLRMEALGETLVDRAGFDIGEFNFAEPPALGGPLAAGIGTGTTESAPGFLDRLDQLEQQVADRHMQLSLLSALLQDKELAIETSPSGLPATRGWLSSSFGQRVDPFTGELAWHNGVDIAGRQGEEILAVASGVVSFSGDKYGYGNTIEITHDSGYLTRYAHNDQLMVQLGEIVKKGQAIATMGSTGRSTGPHVHFEVYKNGRAVDPSSYIRRTIR